MTLKREEELEDEIRRLREDNEHWKEQAWKKADYAEELKAKLARYEEAMAPYSNPNKSAHQIDRLRENVEWLQKERDDLLAKLHESNTYIERCRPQLQENSHLREDNKRLRIEVGELQLADEQTRRNVEAKLARYEVLRVEVAKWNCDTPNCSICKALAALEGTSDGSHPEEK